MKHTPAIRAWVIAGIVGLTVGFVQTAGANTLNVVGKTNGDDNLENGITGTITCNGIGISCEGLADTDALAIPDYPGTTEVGETDKFGNALPDAADTWSGTTADPYDTLPNANLDSVRDALNSALSALGLATVTGGVQTAIAGDGAPFCTNGEALNCTVSNLHALYVVMKNDGFYNFIRISGNNPYSLVYLADKFGLSNVYTFGNIIPIPATLPLFLTGLLGLGFLARRRRQIMEA